MSTGRQVGLLVGLVCALYYNASGNEFHYDDFHSIVHNPHVRQLGNLPDFFIDPSLFSVDPRQAMYRPLLLATYAIIPHQNFANTVGKNASDIALVIDAMDLLHSGRFDGFCLVSSDSDFTRLAARIREQGLDVYGFGEQKTPESFRRACKRFIYTENLLPPSDGMVLSGIDTGVNGAPGGSSKRLPTAAIPHIRTALSQLDDVDG